MKRTALIAFAWAIATSLACGGPPPFEQAPRNGAAMPVLIELFTSEGCSSCPPADALLSELVAEQPVPDIQVIALGEHVDYWNSLGWPDRFSTAAFTSRQADYQARVFTDSAVYTPQLVIDGALQAVGSNARAVRRAIEQAAQSPKATLSMVARLATRHEAQLTIEVDIREDMTRSGPADVVVAAVEDGLVTQVPRGENRGRTLMHSAVTRRLETIGRIDANRNAFSMTTSLPLGDDWNADRIRIVAFVQESGSRRVLGAAAATL